MFSTIAPTKWYTNILVICTIVHTTWKYHENLRLYQNIITRAFDFVWANSISISASKFLLIWWKFYGIRITGSRDIRFKPRSKKYNFQSSICKHPFNFVWWDLLKWPSTIQYLFSILRTQLFIWRRFDDISSMLCIVKATTSNCLF